MQKKSFSSRSLKIIALGVMVIIVVIALFAFLPGEGPHSSPEAVVDAFFKEFQEHNFRGAFALIDPEAVEKGGLPVDEEIEAASEAFKKTPLVAYSIGKIEKLSDSKALVDVTLIVENRGNKKEETVPVPVIKRDGKWYIGVEMF